MRWSINLPSPMVIASSDPSPLRIGPDEKGRVAEIAVNIEHGELSITASGSGNSRAARPDYPEWYHREHLVVFLNPTFDHASRWMFAVDDAGRVIRGAEFVMQGEEKTDTITERLSPPVLEARGIFRRLEQGGFHAELRLPLDALTALSPASSPLGLRIKVGFHDEACLPSLQWPAPNWCNDTPLGFGQLYLERPRFTVESIEFPTPTWSPSTSKAILHVRRGGPAEGVATVRSILPDDSEQSWSMRWSLVDGSRIELPVHFSSRAKWANTVSHTARLGIALDDSHGGRLWVAEFPFGFDCGIIVRERYGCGGDGLRPRPAPADPDFVDQYRRYILDRIPDYRARTTVDGAPSDFFLEDPDGDSSIDLSRPDSLDEVARIIAGQFPDWQDALYAAAVWACHPLVTRHSSSWCRAAASVDVESLPRLGGCFCGDVARLVAVLAERVGRCLGQDFRGYTMGLRGHITTLVITPIGRVVIDGMLGLGFHAADNSRLATIEELRRDRGLARRSWYAPCALGHEFFHGVNDQIICPVRPDGASWPRRSEWAEVSMNDAEPANA